MKRLFLLVLVVFCAVLVASCGRVVRDTVFTSASFVNSEEVSITQGCTPTHIGIDIFATQEAQFRAVCDGIFSKEMFYNERNGMWQVNCTIQDSSEFRPIYGFEPFGQAGDRSPADIQYDKLIPDGSEVQAGDIIGVLYPVGDDAHVHFGVHPESCPMNFFADQAQAEMLALFWRDNPGEQICYDHYFEP